MKIRSILPFAVFGLLLVALFALSSCNNDESGDDVTATNGTPVADGLSGEFSDDWFGGPYSFGGEREGMVKIDFERDKKEDFQRYHNAGLFFSEAAELTSSLFEEWVKENLPVEEKLPVEDNLPVEENLVRKPYGDKRQQYNYVVDTEGRILVGKWKDNVDTDLKEVLDDEKRCPGMPDFRPHTQGMINWFPEESKNGLSPCWLAGLAGNEAGIKKDGLLDAISKHLMLAQGEGNSIDKLFDDDKSLWEEWTDESVKVAYAGEIIVDLDSCTYSLNNNSGTYTPKREGLPDVAEYFADKIGVAPFSYFDKQRREIHWAGNVFVATVKISNVPELCP